MTVPELAMTIAAFGLTARSARGCYRVLIGGRSWWFRAVVTVVGLGYGLGGATGSTASALLTVSGLLAGGTILHDAVRRSDRLAATLVGRLVPRSARERVTGDVTEVDLRRHDRSAGPVGNQRTCLRARTPHVT